MVGAESDVRENGGLLQNESTASEAERGADLQGFPGIGGFHPQSVHLRRISRDLKARSVLP